MSFLAGDRLWLLVAVAALAVAYVVLQFRRRSYAVRFAEVDLLASVAPRRPGWRRHLTAAAFLVLLVASTVAFARPVSVTKQSTNQATVMVDLDVSNSMAAVDVSPNRLEAAEKGAADFVRTLPDGLRVGLVAFAGTASEVTSPTTDHQAVVDAINNLNLGPGTAIGDAVETSLGAIGSAKSAARIVLLSDGTNTVGTPVSTAETDAKTAGVPISTIAYGTPNGVVTIQGQTIPVPADVTTLSQLATTTGGKAYTAQSLDQLRSVYNDIGSKFEVKTLRTEITARFVGIALLAGLVVAATTLLWSPRLP